MSELCYQMSELYLSMLDKIGFNQRKTLRRASCPLVWLWALKLGCAPSINRFLKQKNTLRWRIVSRNESSVPLALYFELQTYLFLPLPPVSISYQVCLCSLPRYSHSNCNCVTNNNSTNLCINGSSAVPRNGSKIYGNINFPTNLKKVY